MKRLVVEKSPQRQLLLGLAGLVLVLTAMDILWVHRFTSPPQVDANGALTSRGQAMRRVDIIWGSVFMVAGGALLGGAIAGLLFRKPVVVLDDEGMELRVAGMRETVKVPWDQVVSVRSAHEVPDGGGRPIAQLVVEVADPALLPASPWGAEWRGRRLYLDAEGWTVPPEQIAVHASLRTGRPPIPDQPGSA